jgi:hypothetical protein
MTESKAIQEMRIIIDQFIDPKNWTEDMKWIGDLKDNPRVLMSRLLVGIKKLEQKKPD